MCVCMCVCMHACAHARVCVCVCACRVPSSSRSTCIAADSDKQAMVIFTPPLQDRMIVGNQYLEHFVGRWFNSRWHVGWLKHNLLHLSKVVLRVAVQNHLTNGDQRIVTMGPDLCVLCCVGGEGGNKGGRGGGKKENEREVPSQYLLSLPQCPGQVHTPR